MTLSNQLEWIVDQNTRRFFKGNVYLKISSAKLRSFCSGFNNIQIHYITIRLNPSTDQFPHITPHWVPRFLISRTSYVCGACRTDERCTHDNPSLQLFTEIPAPGVAGKDRHASGKSQTLLICPYISPRSRKAPEVTLAVLLTEGLCWLERGKSAVKTSLIKRRRCLKQVLCSGNYSQTCLLVVISL